MPSRRTSGWLIVQLILLSLQIWVEIQAGIGGHRRWRLQQRQLLTVEVAPLPFLQVQRRERQFADRYPLQRRAMIAGRGQHALDLVVFALLDFDFQLVLARLPAVRGLVVAYLLAGVIERCVTELGMQFALLGAGNADLTALLRDAAARFPGAVSLTEGYNNDLGQRIYGASDLFLMPSRFEPCGLTQMQAMRYGTIPVVTGVGGLCDTVDDADRMTGGATDLGQIDIEGRIHKPSVFYQVARAELSYTGIEVKQNFVDRIVRSALKRPF